MKTRKLLLAILLLAFLSSCGTAPALPPATAAQPSIVQPIGTNTPVPPTPTPAPTRTPGETDSIATKPEDIAGIWKFSAAGVHWRIDFHPEGYAYPTEW